MALCEGCNEGRLIAEEGGMVCPLCGYYEEEIQLEAMTIAPRGGNIYEPSSFIKTTKGRRLPGQLTADAHFGIHLVRPHRPFTRTGHSYTVGQNQAKREIDSIAGQVGLYNKERAYTQFEHAMRSRKFRWSDTSKQVAGICVGLSMFETGHPEVFWAISVL
jgi:hypothetical protein